ncbi:MAG: hypothetical protein LBF80_06255, partial [Spirochaetaceae bacterium]|jgi:transcriptional regulator with XRE-family HTH domain|nr:hypothetical protein [Spirochaetaceae bacterium]
LADIEAGNTWVSALTLVKFAKAFEIEAYELLKPDFEMSNIPKDGQTDASKALLDRFSKDAAVVIKEALEKGLEYVKKQYMN